MKTFTSSRFLAGNEYDSMDNDGLNTKRSNSAMSYTRNLETPSNLFISLPAEFSFTKETSNLATKY